MSTGGGTTTAPTKAPARGGAGDPAAEYALIALAISLSIAPGAQKVGEEVACKFFYEASVLAATAKSKWQLLMLERIAPKRCIIPIVKVSATRMPMTAAHIERAQRGTRAMLLTYIGINSNNDNRDNACTKQRKAELKPLTCDEYPFATTHQGGAKASTEGVPYFEMRRQGGDVNGFYRRNKFVGGEAFAVVVVP